MLVHRDRPSLRLVLSVVGFVIGLAVLGPPVLAAPPYEVKGVPVDVTAADAAAARDQAIVEGQRTAYRMLMEQLLGAETAAATELPGDVELSNMVQDFEVESEKLSSVRYIGILTFRFEGDAVNARIGRPTDAAIDGLTMLPTGPTQSLAVSVPISGLRQWMDVQRRLTMVPVVQRTELSYLARDEARINLIYIGERVQLVALLSQRQLMLAEDAGQWVLRFGGPPASGEQLNTP